MIYRNDNIDITDESVTGTVKDIMEYFRYELASRCMTGTDCDYENFIFNARNILGIIETLQEDLENDYYTGNSIVSVKQFPTGDLYIESEENLK